MNSIMVKRPSKEELAPLLQVFNSFHPVGKGVEQYLLKNMYCCSVTKGQFLVKSGEICDSIYFIKKGVLRGFIREGDKEITTWITIENEIVAAIGSFILQRPTLENMQAIEDCEMIGIKFTDLDKLYLQYPSFNIIGRKITELYYVYAENRAYITRLHDAEKKYELFLQFYAHFVNRVPLKYIASFLGMTIETLSRVRAKMLHHKRSERI